MLCICWFCELFKFNTFYWLILNWYSCFSLPLPFSSLIALKRFVNFSWILSAFVIKVKFSLNRFFSYQTQKCGFLSSLDRFYAYAYTWWSHLHSHKFKPTNEHIFICFHSCGRNCVFLFCYCFFKCKSMRSVSTELGPSISKWHIQSMCLQFYASFFS